MPRLYCLLQLSTICTSPVVVVVFIMPSKTSLRSARFAVCVSEVVGCGGMARGVHATADGPLD